jgi:anti-sigma factor RsiW
MQCREARELLDSFIGEELLVETNHELLQHLETCPECRAELDGRRRIRSGLQRAFAGSVDLQPRPQFATELTARLRASAEPVARRSWSRRWFAIAASLIAVFGVSAYFLRAGLSEKARLAAGDHQNCAVRFALAEKPITLEEAAQRYDRAFAQLETTPPDVLRTAAGTLRIADRHSCVFGGQRFGHVVFRLDDHLVSVLMARDESSDSPSPAPLSWLPSMNGFRMASLHTSGHVVYIVSDLQDSQFRVVAQALAQPVSQLTASMGTVHGVECRGKKTPAQTHGRVTPRPWRVVATVAVLTEHHPPAP